MASSGSFTSTTVSSLSSTTPRNIQVDWETTQNTTSNTSTLSYEISSTGSSSKWVYAYKIQVIINGTTVYNVTSQTKIYGSTTLKKGSLTIPHNSNGSKTIAVSISAALYASSVNSTYSANITLPTIARASNISAAANKTLGTACSVTWTPASSSFTYSLKFSLGSYSHTINSIKPNKTTSYTYTGYLLPTADFAPQIPNKTSGTMSVVLSTYSSATQNSSTLIGSSTKTFTVTVPSTAIPTLNMPTVTIDNSANTVVKSWGIAVAGYTKAKIAATASGSNGSTISSYTISGGYSTTQTGKTLSYLGTTLTSGTKSFTVTAKDSRGRISSSKTTSSITVYAYSKPAITSLSVARNTSTPTKVTIKANWSYATVNSKNSATATLSYKKSTATSWTTYGTITANQSKTLTATFEEASSYDFRLIVKDSLSNSVQKNVSISTAKVTMDFRKGGKGVSVGKMCETDSFEMGMNMKFYETSIPALSDTYLTLPQMAHQSTVLPAQANLDEYITPGIYTIQSSNIDKDNFPFVDDSILNPDKTDISKIPYTAVTLEIIPIGTNTIMLQRITYIKGDGCKICVRYRRTIDGIYKWTSWFTVSDTFKRILWDASKETSTTGWYMTENHIITLPEKISAQTKGIVLVFSRYDSETGKGVNEQFKEFFVSKQLISSHSGYGHCFDMCSHKFSAFCSKYLYISDTQIKGHADNDATGTASTGVTYNNKYFVLRYVIGV